MSKKSFPDRMQEKHPFKGILYNPGGDAIGAGTTVFLDSNGKAINRNNLNEKQKNELGIFKEFKAGELIRKTQEKAKDELDRKLKTPKSRKTNNQLKIKKN